MKKFQFINLEKNGIMLLIMLLLIGMYESGGIIVLPEDKLREEVKYLTRSMTVKELEKAIKYLQSLAGQTMEEALTNPLYDEGQLTEDDKSALAIAKEDVKAGRVHSLHEIKHLFGDL